MIPNEDVRQFEMCSWETIAEHQEATLQSLLRTANTTKTEDHFQLFSWHTHTHTFWCCTVWFYYDSGVTRPMDQEVATTGNIQYSSQFPESSDMPCRVLWEAPCHL